MREPDPAAGGARDAGRGAGKPGDASPEPALGLFEGFGVELEYMIVDGRSLDVRPVADRLMEAVAGEPVSEFELGEMAWSNELALHVLELKTNGPAPTFEGLPELFQAGVARANGILEAMECRLLPGGMHPWMDPDRELRLWPHEYTEVYRTFDRVFGCRGHGWANLQSTHLNLPFRGNREFAALHAAIRAVLPILPALTASSPFVDGKRAVHLDQRLAAYRSNSVRVPSVAGRIVPEPVGSREAYESAILGRVYRDLAPLDPEGVLRHEWVNARGAIARFQRGAIEIRVIDAQECPGADVAVVALVARVVESLTRVALDDPSRFDALGTDRLAAMLDLAIERGDRAPVDDPEYVARLGLTDAGPEPTAGRLWRELALGPGASLLGSPALSPFLEVILEHGPLARRLVAAAGPDPSPGRLRAVYGTLADCLAAGRPFLPAEVP